MSRRDVLLNGQDAFWEMIENLAWCNVSDMLLTPDYFLAWFGRLAHIDQEIFRHEYTRNKECIRHHIMINGVVEEFNIKNAEQIENISCHLVLIGQNIFAEALLNIHLVKFFMVYEEYQNIDVANLLLN